MPISGIVPETFRYISWGTNFVMSQGIHTALKMQSFKHIKLPYSSSSSRIQNSSIKSERSRTSADPELVCRLSQGNQLSWSPDLQANILRSQESQNAPQASGNEFWGHLTRGVSTPLLMEMGGVNWALQPYCLFWVEILDLLDPEFCELSLLTAGFFGCWYTSSA